MQVGEAAKTYFSIASPKTCPYFQHSVPGLLRDRDQEWRIGEPNIVEALRDDAKTADAWEVKGNKITLNKFMSAIRESKTDDREVHTRLIAQLYCCIEEGMLRDKKLKKQSL